MIEQVLASSSLRDSSRTTQYTEFLPKCPHEATRLRTLPGPRLPVRHAPAAPKKTSVRGRDAPHPHTSERIEIRPHDQPLQPAASDFRISHPTCPTPSASQPEPCGVEQPANRLAVANLPALDLRQRLRE